MRPLVVVAAVAVVVVSSAGCPGLGCEAETPLVMTVGVDECAEPCTMDFGGVVAPLSDQKRITFEVEGCSMFGSFGMENATAEFAVVDQSVNVVAFALVQFAPTEPRAYASTLVLGWESEQTSATTRIDLVGVGLDPNLE